MDAINEPGTVHEQYRTESRLERRRSVWRPSADGRNPQDLAAGVVRDAAPRTILEVGCGTGAFAERLAAENPRARVVATDQSERFVELAAARGVSAQVADIQGLPFDDDQFDVVTAMWMLYHVADLHRGLGEVIRVLRPGGLFVAATNGENHLAELLTEAGGEPLVTQFRSENGAEALGQHFDRVRQEDVATRAVFDSHTDAGGYLATFDETLAGRLPHFDGPASTPGPRRSSGPGRPPPGLLLLRPCRTLVVVRHRFPPRIPSAGDYFKPGPHRSDPRTTRPTIARMSS